MFKEIRELACLFNNFRSIMKVRGKNDYRQAHNDGRKRQNRGESPIDLTVDMDDYNECKRLIYRFWAQNPAYIIMSYRRANNSSYFSSN